MTKRSLTDKIFQKATVDYPADGDCRYDIYRKMYAQKAFYVVIFGTTPTAVQVLNLLQELFRVGGREEVLNADEGHGC